MMQATKKRKLVTALIEKEKRRAGGTIDLVTWTAVHRRNLKPGVPFNLTDHLYLLDIYQCRAQHMAIYKSSQMGASEYAVSYAIHSCAERNATVLYVFPTDRHVSDFSKARFGPAIEASSYLDSLVVDARGAGGMRGSDQVTLKRFGKNFLYLRGAQVQPDGRAPQLKSIDADIIVHDELDEMDSRAPGITHKRLGHSSIAEIRDISTPSYPGIGIHEVFVQSDQREWHVPCSHCGEWQPMTINDVVIEWDKIGRPVAWHGQKEGRAWIACRKCGRELNRLAPGRWVATHPGREIVGFHLTKLFSAQINLLGIVHSLQETDETIRKETFNQDLGETYTPTGNKITDAVLNACLRDYGHGPAIYRDSDASEDTLMGVDVGKVLHTVIRGPAVGENGERPQRWAGEVDSFEDLGNLFHRFNVNTCVVDALPETRSAREFQAVMPAGGVWLAYYTTAPIGTKHIEATAWDKEKGVVTLDRTRLLDITMSRFYDGKNTLPVTIRGLRDYYAHMKAPVRVIEENSHGDRVAKYIESGADHYAHAENYCTAASLADSWLMW